MAVPTRITDFSTTAGNNSPTGSESIGTSLDDYLRGYQAVTRLDLASKGADIASASPTTDLGAVGGLAHDITGTTAITAFGTVAAGVWKIIKFEDVLTLTHNATSLILPGGANIATANGDIAIVISEGSGNWRCVSYFRAANSPTQDTSETVKGVIELATTAEVQNGTDTVRAVTPATLHTGKPVTGTVTAAAGQASIDYAIPSWAKKITVSFNELSSSSTSRYLIQLGDGAPGIETATYVSTSTELNQSSGSAGTASTAGFVIDVTDGASIVSGHFTLTLVNAATFTWIGSGLVKKSTTSMVFSAGSKALSAALTTVRLTTVNGTDTFDAGSVNVMWE